MQTELAALDERLRALIRLTEGLRTENTQLRQQLAAALGDNRRLRDRSARARARIESLLQRLPDDAVVAEESAP